MHAGLVFHLKVGEKCCWRLTLGLRDLAKEQRKRWKHTSTTSSLVLPRAFSGLLHSSICGNAGCYYFGIAGCGFGEGGCHCFYHTQTCPRALVFLVQQQPQAILEKRQWRPLRCLRARLYTTVQRGVEDASSLQNAEAPTCGLALADSSLRVPERSSAGL